MLFNSAPFLFVFLPVALVGFYCLGAVRSSLAIVWLGIASIAFYAYWDVRFTPILLASILFNYLSGYSIHLTTIRGNRALARYLLAAGIGGNLLALGYWKYAFFVTSNLNLIPDVSVPVVETILPLGISFFTFTQIAYLVDVSRGHVKAYQFYRYFVFVTYFPHLIAGPIIHHASILPQLNNPATFRPIARNLALGLSMFVIGLVKKVLIADQISAVVAPIFRGAAGGAVPTFETAWTGALAYTVQLYFDFSGYCAMAIGLSLMFNISLPINFNSPYKSRNIIDFWKRWHITLSSFLRDYLYIPLGGKNRRYLNLMITMLLGGIWHGAGWTFVAWGALHGFYLVCNHAFRALRGGPTDQSGMSGRATALASGALTFLCVVVGWVFFRADNIQSALLMLGSMTTGCTASSCLALGSVVTTENPRVIQLGIAAALIVAWTLPNSQELLSRYRPFRSFRPSSLLLRRALWRPKGWWWWTALGTAGGVCVIVMMSNTSSEFLYFQF